MARKFEQVWKRLQKNEQVILTCPEKGFKVIRAAIYDEKYKHTRARQQTDLPSYGRIKIVKQAMADKPGHIRLIITLGYSGDNL